MRRNESRHESVTLTHYLAVTKVSVFRLCVKLNECASIRLENHSNTPGSSVSMTWHKFQACIRIATDLLLNSRVLRSIRPRKSY